MTANIAAATNSGQAMSKSRIDALADAALARDEAAPPPTTKKLSPSLLAAAEAAHRADEHLAPPAAKDPSGSSLSLASLPGSTASYSSASLPGEAHSLYLAALLDEQRRRSLLMEPPAAALGLGGPLPFNGYAALHGQTKADASLPAPSRRRKPNFAEKLHAVLGSKDCQDAVGWLPSGRSFCIKNQDEFVTRILPKHFREAKFESFARRLKRWGFRKVYQTGLSKTIFGHELFHRDRPELCLVMNGRQKVAASDCKHGTLVDDREAVAAAGPIAPQQGPSYLDAVPFRPQLQSQLALGPLPFSMHPPGLPASFTPSFPAPFHRPFVSDDTGLDAAAILRDARAIAARSLPGPHEDPARTLVAARAQLTRLNDDIANCEEQLAILHQLRDLKERRRMLGDATAEGSSQGASPEV
ncbi:hypothetical protein ACHAXT_006863 [Thalassiosira profunda]